MNQPRRPSAAIVVAVLGLVAALAGTAVAGPDAITSTMSKTTSKKKVKKLVKKEVAKQIDKATGPSGPSGPAGAPGGGSPTTAFSFRTSADQTVDNLVNAGGLTIDVSCTGTVVTATANTSVDNSSIYTASVNTGNGVVDNEDNDADFDSGDPRPLLGENDELQVGHTSYAAGTNGPVVDVRWSSDTTPNVDCLFVGQVTVG